MTNSMLVALGKDGIKTMDDFAGYAPDDLVGWAERNEGETKKFEGLFAKFEVSRAEAEAMIVQARLAAGWITKRISPPKSRLSKAVSRTPDRRPPRLPDSKIRLAVLRPEWREPI
jgi:hypothetical protein